MLDSKMMKNFILLAVRPSIFSCRMVGLRNVLTMCPEKGRFDLHASPRLEKDVYRIAGPG